VTYVGSTAQELKERMGKHAWKGLLENTNTTVDTYEVTGELNVEESGKGTSRSALNEALRSAEQQVKDKVESDGKKTVNKRAAATENNMSKWRLLHKVGIDMSSPKASFKGGSLLSANAGFALWDAFLNYRNMDISKYVFAPYLLEDQGGVFTMSYARNGWFSSTKYWKTYQSGPKAGQKEYFSGNDFDYWEDEAKAMWGYLDFWGNFVPGLLNPVLPVIDPNEA
jgi:hypothetical protein